jgi:undecaprenyl diphosphate synthase
MALSEKKLKHIAFIMDGNGRWAKSRGLKALEGHHKGSDTVSKVINYSSEAGIRYITFYAFSTENWLRPPLEVAGLMRLLGKSIDDNIQGYLERGFRVRILGRKNKIPLSLIKKLENAEKLSVNNTNMDIIIAFNYGGRAEIADAAKKIAKDVSAGVLKPSKVNEKLFSKYLYQSEVPDPDLLIRTSGEYRLSNFMLWQLSYSELYFTDTLWPDFGKDEFNNALDTFYMRERRYGAR